VKFLAVLGLLATASGAATTGAELRFLSCPVYRDTDAGKKSGCWLATDPASGIRYDITTAPTKADWNRAVLVEGRVAANPADNPCGGVVLEAARVSVLDRPCTRHMLPAEGFPGRKFVLPDRNVRPLYASHDLPPKPWVAQNFIIPFDFDSDFITYQLSDYYLDRAVSYALDVRASRVDIMAYAATTPTLVSGERLAEDRAIARSRAERVRDWFTMRGIPLQAVHIRWQDAKVPRPGPETDMLVAPSLRVVDIRITPGA
jgi:hypothetical protein